MKHSSPHFLLAALGFAILGGPVLRATGAQPPAPGEISALLQKLAPKAQGRAAGPALVAEAATISMTSQGFLRAIGASPGQHFPPEPGMAGKSPELIARNFLSTQGRLFGIQSTNASYVTKRNRENNGRHYVRLQQSHRGIPVVAAEVTVQVNNLGGLDCVLSDLSVEVQSLDTNLTALSPTLSTSEAIAKAKGAFPTESPVNIRSTTPRLAIFSPAVMDETGAPVLVWDLEVSSQTLLEANARVLVNAANGQLVRVWTQIHSALNRQIFDANTTTNDPGTLVRAEGQVASGISDADNAYTFLGETYNFYKNVHNRDSLNGGGMTLSATVRYCSPNGTNAPSCPPPNLAFYSGNRMYFGAGYVADDVTAHELTHGVTGFESGLIYANNSGAINESLSDIWGEFVDLTYNVGGGNDAAGVRWDIGEDIPGGRIRSMKNPTALGDPDRQFSPLYIAPTNSPNSTNDFGGVHSNSGVNNKLCYLLTDGDTFNGQIVRGVGLNAVAALYYEVQINFLSQGSGWADLYNALRQAAVNLNWNTTDRNNLFRACLAVEIIGLNDGQHVYVDKASLCLNPAGLSTCSLNYGPYISVGQGVSGAQTADFLHIRTGTYHEPMTIDKTLTLEAYGGPVTIGQ